jgi:NhaP-type Na+/H+ or K+/H+ antiporter
MLLSILGVAGVGYFLLGFTPAAALLLGAVLAPTDPVLAGEVAVEDARDRDRLRYALSGEAGLNDGTAFPFVVLALGLVAHEGTWGGWVWGWAAERVLWAVPAGLGLGFALGLGLGRLAIWVRQHTRDPQVSSDFLLLALIALAYAGAEFVHAWGFLAVFAAGVGLRRAEVRSVRRSPAPPPLSTARPGPDAPAETLLAPELSEEDLAHPAVASGAVLRDVLSFGEVLERFLAMGIVILVGVLVGPAWDWRGLVVAALLFGLIRPAAALLVLRRSPLDTAQRNLVAWLGIRGIGSLYYLAYAVGEGLGRARAEEVSSIALSVVAASIVVHGLSVTPLLHRYERGFGRPSA